MKLMAGPQGLTAQRTYDMFQWKGPPQWAFSAGHTTADGHVFVSDYSNTHCITWFTVFVIDKSRLVQNFNVQS